MRRALMHVVLGAALASAAPGAYPHHTFDGIYDRSEDLKLEGVVREFRFVHPHPLLMIDVRGVDGRKATWRAELDNRFELEEIGMRADTFKPGDAVTVNGSPGREHPNILYLWKLVRPADGLRYEQIGMTPHLTRGKAGA